MTKICVVTKVNTRAGILYEDLLLDLPEGIVVWGSMPYRLFPQNGEIIQPVRVPAFGEGQIVICDDDYKEIPTGCYIDAYDIEFEVFDNIEDAIKRSKEIGKKPLASGN